MVYYIVGSLLLFTTITDIFWRRIPNILILIYFGAGIFILNSPVNAPAIAEPTTLAGITLVGSAAA